MTVVNANGDAIVKAVTDSLYCLSKLGRDRG